MEPAVSGNEALAATDAATGPEQAPEEVGLDNPQKRKDRRLEIFNEFFVPQISKDMKENDE